MKLLVTAGPTREHMDPVRFLGNRSSGKMGYAVGAVAARRGHEVVLVSGPVALVAPPVREVVSVVSAQDMLTAVRQWVPWCDALVMTAAVADWRPAVCESRKIKKSSVPHRLQLEPTEDILQAVRLLKGSRLFVGFAAETDHLEEEARRKLEQKGLDLVIANDVSQPDAGFEADTNRVVVFAKDGSCERWPLLPKIEVAERLVQWLETRRGEGAAGPDYHRLKLEERCRRQWEFIAAIDRLKQVLRHTVLEDGSRRENAAEHCWHVAVMAMVLAEHAGPGIIDVGRVLRLLVVHDLVEIEAGDTYCYDEAGQADRLARERQAAERVFGLLPVDQAEEFRSLWNEFEERRTAEARYAAALDRLQPLLLNYLTRGAVWRKNGVTADRVVERNRHIREGGEALWTMAQALIADAKARGDLLP